MAKFTNSQIAADLNLWNEYFNTSALMTDEDFHALIESLATRGRPPRRNHRRNEAA